LRKTTDISLQKKVPSGDELSFLKGNSAKKIHDDMSVTLFDKYPSYFLLWVARFGTGHLSTEDEERSGSQLVFP
jgi:hypothetical protein